MLDVPQAAFVKGVAVPTAAFERFITANNLPIEINDECSPGVSMHEIAHLDAFFKARNIGGDVKVFIPRYPGNQRQQYVFICFDWIVLFGARDVSTVLQKQMPPRFPHLCQELGVAASPSTFVILSQEISFQHIETNWLKVMADDLVWGPEAKKTLQKHESQGTSYSNGFMDDQKRNPVSPGRYSVQTQASLEQCNRK